MNSNFAPFGFCNQFVLKKTGTPQYPCLNSETDTGNFFDP